MIMKMRSVSLFLMIFATTAVAHAQFVKSIGLNGGAVWAKQEWNYKNVNEVDDPQYHARIHAGLELEMFRHPWLGMLAGAGIAQKGNLIEVEITNAGQPEGTGEYKTYRSTFNYAYLELLLRVHREFGPVTPFVFVGPRLDYMLSYDSDLSLKVIEDEMNDAIFGLSYGLGIEYRFGRVGLAAIFTHQYDFSYVYDKEPETFGLENIRNKAFFLDLGIKYYFGK